jgi:hypothetical protein
VQRRKKSIGYNGLVEKQRKERMARNERKYWDWFERDIFLRAREERDKENGTGLLFFLKNTMGRSNI